MRKTVLFRILGFAFGVLLAALISYFFNSYSLNGSKATRPDSIVRPEPVPHEAATSPSRFASRRSPGEPFPGIVSAPPAPFASRPRLAPVVTSAYPHIDDSEATPAGDPLHNETGEQKKLKDRKETLLQLPKGKIVLNAPMTMKVGETRSVYANVGINVPVDILKKHSTKGDRIVESALRVSSEMSAALIGPGFKINPTTPEEQGVAEGFPTVWSWNIEARQEGEQELVATLYVIIPAADRQSRQRIDSFTHKIGVTVKEQTWSDWLKSSKEAIEALQVIAIALGSGAVIIFGWLKLFRRPKSVEEKTITD